MQSTSIVYFYHAPQYVDVHHIHQVRQQYLCSPKFNYLIKKASMWIPTLRAYWQGPPGMNLWTTPSEHPNQTGTKLCILKQCPEQKTLMLTENWLCNSKVCCKTPQDISHCLSNKLYTQCHLDPAGSSPWLLVWKQPTISVRCMGTQESAGNEDTGLSQTQNILQHICSQIRADVSHMMRIML